MKPYKSKNLGLFIGLVLLLLLLAVYFFPQLFTNSDPYATQTVIMDSTGTVRAAPFPPGIKGMLGSDELGRDLYSLVIYGTRQSLKVVFSSILFLLLLAFIPGLVAGFGRNICRWLLKVLNITFSTIPALVFCLIMLKFPFLKELPVEKSLYAFALVIAIVETGRMGTFIQQRVEEILKEPFIEGAVVLGKNPFQIAFQNVVPHLLPGLIVFASLEAARVLFIMCQLAVFNMVAGNIGYDDEVFSMMGRFLPYEPEWSAMLGSSIRRVLTHTWVVVPPLSAFFISILSFNLIAEGLRIEFEKKNSHFISIARKAIYLLSPKAFVYDIGNIRRRPVRGIVKLSVVALLITIIAFPRYLLYNSFNAGKAIEYINQLSTSEALKQDSFKDSRDILSAYITGKLKASGLEPAGQNDYTYTWMANNINYCTLQKISISTDQKNWQQLKADRDFKAISSFDFSFEGFISDKLEESRDKAYIAYAPNDDYALMQMISAIDRDSLCKVVFLIRPDFIGKNIVRSGVSTYQKFSTLYSNKNVPVIEVDQYTGEKLLGSKASKVSIELKTGLRDYLDCKNIYAVIPGTDKDTADQYIVVGAGYDIRDFNLQQGLNNSLSQISAVAVNLELADALQKMGRPKKTIVFAFWDFHGVSDTGASAINEAKGISSIWNSLYIDLKGLYPAGGDNVTMDLSDNSPGMLDNQRMVKYLQNELIHMGISIKNERIGSAEAEAALYNAFGSVIIEAAEPGAAVVNNASGKDAVRLDKTKIKKIGQALANAITQAAY